MTPQEKERLQYEGRIRVQSQASLTDQLKRLIPIANRQGLYDAADYLTEVVEQVENKK